MIDLKDLQKFHQKKEKVKKESYRKILKACHKKIVLVSQTGAYECWYVVPEVVFGLPVYDIEECSKYIYKKLVKNGLLVEHYSPNFLYICWDPKKIENSK